MCLTMELLRNKNIILAEKHALSRAVFRVTEESFLVMQILLNSSQINKMVIFLYNLYIFVWM